RMLSPQTDQVQLVLHRADSPMSSHCSRWPASLTNPSPQKAILQVGGQLSSPASLLSSHSSPGSMNPFPHPSLDLQSELHPSPELVLPSSHTSPTCGSGIPLPHVSLDLQSWLHPSPSWMLPSSHTSPGSLMPSPQRDSAGMQASPVAVHLN